MLTYQEPLFRPPAEANSLIFQIAYGCPHNKCRFCAMYKGVRYEPKPLESISAEIAEAARRFPDTRRVFLADGDAMCLSFETLKAIIEDLNGRFPRLSRVNTYANGSSILAKTAEELRDLRELKLNTLYLGLESGDEETLRMVSKGETATEMARAVEKAQNSGFKCSVMALLGIAGKQRSEQHAAETARIINEMSPKLLSILRFIEVPGIKMFDGYKPLSEMEAVTELRAIIERLELDGTVFTANHASNPVPLKGRLPKDKKRLLETVDAMISSGTLDNQSPGPLPLYL